MKLLIVESPSKAKTITKYLDGEYRVVASVGHVRDLPKSNKNAIDIEAGFVPHYEISADKRKIVADIKALVKKASEIYLASDPDREGEAIAWHVAETCGIKHPRRVLFYEITPKAVKEAVAAPRELDVNLRKAQEARRVLDRLVGYDLSGLVWKKVRYGLSAGRVQSPALHILVVREKEIRAFVPETFWKLTAECDTIRNERLTLTCSDEPRDQKIVDTILESGRAGKWIVTDVKESAAKRSPRAPFTTSTMQQAASSRFGMSPSRTMRTAQKLYEAGYITYMRTDSVNMGKDALATIASLIETKYGKNFVHIRTFTNKSKNAQEAHEAIRPTDATKVSAGATGEEKKLYELIRIRAIASQMADAELLRTKIVANTADHSLPDFAATGSRVTFAGWLTIDPASRGEDVELPETRIGESLTLIDLSSEEKQTEPPHRYTEAGLVKELEQRGIGRPSTYASIIKTIQDRGYVDKDGKALRPTETGEVVDDFIAEHFSEIVSDVFTADMENKLDEIAAGTRDYAKTLSEFYVPFKKELKEKEKLDKATDLGQAPEEMKCPECDGSMIIKLGRSGKFYSCAKFPECTGALTIEGNKIEGPKETGELCPECSGKLLERDGKYGKFVACGNYPKCKYIKKDEAAAAANSTGVKCPVCKKGEMTEKRGRFGIFYACSNYPDCKHAIKAKPTGALCPTCGSLMMEGTKTIPERCSKKECPNHNPHKIQETVNK